MTVPRLSVIVPAHNAARFLPTTLAAASRNSADDIEWILIDDGSTDGTRAALHRFTPPTGRAIVVEHGEAHGLSGARNAGLDVAAGRYVTFLDADDWLAPGYLPRMADAIERLGVDFVRTDHVQVIGTRRSPRRVPEARRWSALAASDGISVSPMHPSAVDYPYAWSAVYDVRLRDRGLLHVDPTIKTAEDRLMAWRLHLFADTFAVVSEIGYFYRREVAGSLTMIGDERQLHFFDSFDAIAADVIGRAEFAAYGPKFVRSYLAMIAHHDLTQHRLHREVRAEFRHRAGRTLRALPDELVRSTIDGMDARRARILRRLR
jgi:glycosyltransferase involved in cell wall biosynthesis